MADESIHPDRNTPPGWLQRLHEEELSGFAFAFKARAIALGVVFLWVVFSSSWTRLPVLVAAMVLFFVVGWIGYATRKSRYMLAIQTVCALIDVAIIVMASHYPEQTGTNGRCSPGCAGRPSSISWPTWRRAHSPFPSRSCW